MALKSTARALYLKLVSTEDFISYWVIEAHSTAQSDDPLDVGPSVTLHVPCLYQIVRMWTTTSQRGQPISENSADVDIVLALDGSCS